MDYYDTDLWKFLRQNDEHGSPFTERCKLAKSFMLAVNEVFKASETKTESTKTFLRHRDIKPTNILINLDVNGFWNGELVLTDYGISADDVYKKREIPLDEIALKTEEMRGLFLEENQNTKSAGTPGWAPPYQFANVSSSDTQADTTYFPDRNSLLGQDAYATRLTLIMIFLSWNRAWTFIWEPIDNSEEENIIEEYIAHFLQIDLSFTKISEYINFLDKTFQENPNLYQQWEKYCQSSNNDFSSMSKNTQKSIDVWKEFSNMQIDLTDYATGGSLLHFQNATNLCHSFAIITSFRTEIRNVRSQLGMKMIN